MDVAIDRCRRSRRRSGKTHKIQHGHHFQLFYGNCQIQGCTHALGANREPIWPEMRLRLQDEGACDDYSIQPNDIRCLCQFAAHADGNDVGRFGRGWIRITVTPFDAQYKQPDDFSERLARNQQLLLKEESHLDKITDPAGGSYYVETLTVSIADAAWKLFLEIEDGGGFYAALKNGNIQSQIRETSQNVMPTWLDGKNRCLARTNSRTLRKRQATKSKLMEKCGCGCAHENGQGGIPTERAASDFEALRLATEKSAVRPKVFMLTIGNLAMRLARAQFSSNFFACAGYEIIDNLGFETVKRGNRCGHGQKGRHCRAMFERRRICRICSGSIQAA